MVHFMIAFAVALSTFGCQRETPIPATPQHQVATALDELRSAGDDERAAATRQVREAIRALPQPDQQIQAHEELVKILAVETERQDL